MKKASKLNSILKLKSDTLFAKRAIQYWKDSGRIGICQVTRLVV